MAVVVWLRGLGMAMGGELPWSPVQPAHMQSTRAPGAVRSVTLTGGHVISIRSDLGGATCTRREVARPRSIHFH